MYPFESMNLVSVYTVLTIVFVFIILVRVNPYSVVTRFIQLLFQNRKFLIHFALVLAILYVNKIELMYEQSKHLSYDFTPFIFRLEGNLTASIQNAFASPFLTFVFTYFYIIILPVMMIGSILIYSYNKNLTVFYATCYAIALNYVIAIPFYLYFPVNEVWFYLQPQVKLLIPEVFPSFEVSYRPFSGLDNCFPSLHTSLSIAMSVLAFRSELRAWRAFVFLSTVMIIFSIFYLGIHWLADMLTGCVLGIFAGQFGFWLARRTSR